jgi:hypothetical protein
VIAARDWWAVELADSKPLRIRAFSTPSFRVLVVLETCKGVKHDIVLDGLTEQSYQIATVGGLFNLQIKLQDDVFVA